MRGGGGRRRWGRFLPKVFGVDVQPEPALLQIKIVKSDSDQNGSKTIPFGTAHTYEAHMREYQPPGIVPYKESKVAK